MLTPDTRFGRYVIKSAIGAGGMGDVYLARDTTLDRSVAVKMLSDECCEDPERLGRFAQEAKTASGLNHPNIITIFEFGEHEDTHFMTCEYIDGEELSDVVSGKTLSIEEVLEISIQVVSALRAAHEAGIVHRDIKSNNIMIRNDGIVKVLDFGLAKLLRTPFSEDIDGEAQTIAKVETIPGLIMGTPNYMSPEQAKGREIDSRTDIFSFGVVLYEMISGRLPFEGNSAMETIGAILHKEPERIEDSRVPKELLEIVGKSLQKDREDRYQNIGDVLDELTALKKRIEFEAELNRASPSDKEAKTQIPNSVKDEGSAKVLRQANLPADEIADSTDESLEAPTVTLKQQTVNLAKDFPADPAAERQKPYKNSKRDWRIAGVVSILFVVLGLLGYYFFNGDSRQIDSIAVMPFVNESGNEEVEYLSDGMTETLISSLTQIPNLSVKARSTVFYYKGKSLTPKQIGEELGVEAVLLGRVVQRGDDLKLSLELVDTRTLDALWSENYNRKMNNLVVLQSEIAKNVSDKLKVKLSGEEETKVTKTYTTKPEAYQAYLKGRFHWNKRTEAEIKKGIEFFNEAIELDPDYALAWSGFADSHLLIPSTSASQTDKAYTIAKSAAEKAIALDPDLAEARTSLARILHRNWDFVEAEKEFQNALRLNPKYATAHHWYSIYLETSGKHDDAVKEARIATELDPLSFIINFNLGFRLFNARRFAEATQQYQKTLELFPNFPYVHQWLAFSLAYQGKYTEAVSECKKAIEVGGNSLRLCLAYVYSKSDKKREAKEILAEDIPVSDYSEFNRILIYANLGDRDKVFGLLEKRLREKSFSILFLRADPNLDDLRDDPRYKEMLKRIGLPE